MKLKILIILLSIISGSSFAQQKAFEKQLWEMIDPCYSNFMDEDEDQNGVSDEAIIIDDAKNGYIEVSGSYPTCGCYCSSTAGAYRKNDGEYIFIATEEDDCSWTKKISSTTEILKLLPDNFGITPFIPEINTIEKLEIIDNAIFYLHVDIPRKGTDTEVFLELIPFGIAAKGDQFISFGYSEKDLGDWKKIRDMWEFTQKIDDEKTLSHILSGTYSQISEKDKKILSQFTEGAKIKEECISLEELTDLFIQFRKIHELYIALEYDSMVLSWDRIQGKFHIKEKRKKNTEHSISFKEFILKASYWGGIC